MDRYIRCASACYLVVTYNTDHTVIQHIHFHTRSSLRYEWGVWVSIWMNNHLKRGFICFIGVQRVEIVIQRKGMCDKCAHIALTTPHIFDRARKIIDLAAYANIALVIIMQII